LSRKIVLKVTSAVGVTPAYGFVGQPDMAGVFRNGYNVKGL